MSERYPNCCPLLLPLSFALVCLPLASALFCRKQFAPAVSCTPAQTSRTKSICYSTTLFQSKPATVSADSTASAAAVVGPRALTLSNGLALAVHLAPVAFVDRSQRGVSLQRRSLCNSHNYPLASTTDLSIDYNRPTRRLNFRGTETGRQFRAANALTQADGCGRPIMQQLSLSFQTRPSYPHVAGRLRANSRTLRPSYLISSSSIRQNVAILLASGSCICPAEHNS